MLKHLRLLINYCYAYPAERNSRIGFLSPEQSFQFQLECPEWDNTTCNNASIALQQVGAIISRPLLFKVPVKICMVVNSSTDLSADEYQVKYDFAMPQSSDS